VITRAGAIRVDLERAASGASLKFLAPRVAASLHKPLRVSPSSRLTLQDCLVRTRAAGEADKCADAIVPNVDVLDDAQLARKTRTAVSPCACCERRKSSRPGQSAIDLT